MTCKNCIHYAVCAYHADELKAEGYTVEFDTRSDAERVCLEFTQKSEWIGVEERLPDDGNVRVAVVLRETPVTAHIGTNKIDTDRYLDGHWVRWRDSVTHWMPLHEVPQTKGKSNGQRD